MTQETLIHPWQSGPTELISLAIHHLRNNSDFDRRIAFLLLDIGIETLLKTYLTLPDKITGAKTKFHERKDVQGNKRIGNFLNCNKYKTTSCEYLNEHE